MEIVLNGTRQGTVPPQPSNISYHLHFVEFNRVRELAIFIGTFFNKHRTYLQKNEDLKGFLGKSIVQINKLVEEKKLSKESLKEVAQNYEITFQSCKELKTFIESNKFCVVLNSDDWLKLENKDQGLIQAIEIDPKCKHSISSINERLDEIKLIANFIKVNLIVISEIVMESLFKAMNKLNPEATRVSNVSLNTSRVSSLTDLIQNDPKSNKCRCTIL